MNVQNEKIKTKIKNKESRKKLKTVKTSSKTSKTLKRPPKYLFIRKENTANFANIRLDNILNQ